MNKVSPPAYAAEKFVNRKDEINLVLEKARALAAGRVVDQRVVVFTNGRGTGKTWLLHHLETRLASISDLLVYRFRLSEYPPEPLLAITDILTDLQRVIGGREQLGETLMDMSRNLLLDLRSRLERRALVLLVDEVHESDWQLLAALEDYLLGPLAVEPRALIVMAGRGRPYPWRTPELRLKAEFVDLKPFPDVSFTTEQLKHQREEAVARAAQIHDLSDGNPLANYLLAVHKDPAAALDQVIEGMLEPVPTERRRWVRDYLEALCVLRSFDEERIPAMLAAYYHDDSYRGMSYIQARQVREELDRWAFARWNGEAGGYILDEPTRKLVERYLQTAQPDRWRQLHDTAHQLYEEWGREYPGSRSRWQPEAQYHGKMISRCTNLRGSSS